MVEDSAHGEASYRVDSLAPIGTGARKDGDAVLTR